MFIKTVLINELRHCNYFKKHLRKNMKRFIQVSLVGLVCLCAKQNIAQENNAWKGNRPDGHAPISVMADHYHNKGELMFSYRAMIMGMEGILSGTRDHSKHHASEQYMAVPDEMQMNMHMLGVMYAPLDRLTLAVMANYLDNKMSLTMHHQDGMQHHHHSFQTASTGFGDVQVNGIIKLMNTKRQSVHVTLGASLPSGSIEKRHDTPMMQNAWVAYPMQLGSGTVDPQLGATYLGQTDKASWGVQTSHKIRLYENKYDYRLGDAFNSVAWTAYRFSNTLSASLSAKYQNQGSIRGANPNFNPMMMPLFVTENSGAERLFVGLGLNYYFKNEALRGLRIATEFQLPVYQKVNGIQMKQSYCATLGVQYALSK